MSVFGFSTETITGDFLPIVKYDARAGRIFRVDRVDTGGQVVSEPVDITRNFKAIFDLEHIETGWIKLGGGGAPDFRLVPMGTLLPDRPPGNDHQGKPLYNNGIRLMLKLAKECGGDKPIREIAGTSKAFLSGVEKLYHDFEAGRKGENADKLPVVVLKDTIPITSGQGAKQSTNYMPVFEIVGWSLRGDLVFQPKGGAQIRPASPSVAATIMNAPPATGGQRVAPPAADIYTPEKMGHDFG